MTKRPKRRADARKRFREQRKRDAEIAYIRSLAPDHVIRYVCEAIRDGVPEAEIVAKARAMVT